MIFQTNHLPTGGLHDLENKEDSFQDIQNAGVMVSLELLGRHKPEPGGFCLYLSSIICLGVKRRGCGIRYKSFVEKGVARVFSLLVVP
jgi:hypothetical protein